MNDDTMPFRFGICDPDNRFAGLPLSVQYVDGRTWVVASDVSYRMTDGTISTVRAGFDIDFASIPRWLWSVAPPAGDNHQPYGLAALWHDWLYRHKQINGRPITRKQADDLFLEIMLYVGVRTCLAWAMYGAVRAFGWILWNRRPGPEPDAPVVPEEGPATYPQDREWDVAPITPQKGKLP